MNDRLVPGVRVRVLDGPGLPSRLARETGIVTGIEVHVGFAYCLVYLDSLLTSPRTFWFYDHQMEILYE